MKAEEQTPITAKEYLQEKHEYFRTHWNLNEYIDDNWWAKEMEQYAELRIQQEREKWKEEVIKIVNAFTDITISREMIYEEINSNQE